MHSSSGVIINKAHEGMLKRNCGFCIKINSLHIKCLFLQYGLMDQSQIQYDEHTELQRLSHVF